MMKLGGVVIEGVREWMVGVDEGSMRQESTSNKPLAGMDQKALRLSRQCEKS
jgi:hypothetical protein